MAAVDAVLASLIAQTGGSTSTEPKKPAASVDQMVKDIVERQECTEAAMADLFAKDAAKDHARKREWTLDISAKASKQAESYTKAIVAIGYVVAFGEWSFMKDHMPLALNYSVAFLLGVSAMSFVLWEVWRALGETSIARELGLLATSESPTFEEWERRVHEYESKTRALNFQTLRWNALSFWTSVTTGFLAGMVMSEWFFLGALSEFLRLFVR